MGQYTCYYKKLFSIVTKESDAFNVYREISGLDHTYLLSEFAFLKVSDIVES